MLCEKCHHRQTEWGTVCEECEREQAAIDRKIDMFRLINRLQWYALWMSADVVVFTLIMVGLLMLCNTSNLILIVLTVLMLLALAMTLYEWWLWRGYAKRMKNGDCQQVAYELLHHPKGFWREELRRTYVSRKRRHDTPLGGMVVYASGLHDLHRERMALEVLAKSE